MIDFFFSVKVSLLLQKHSSYIPRKGTVGDYTTLVLYPD